MNDRHNVKFSSIKVGFTIGIIVLFFSSCKKKHQEYYNDGTNKSENYKSDNLKDGVYKGYDKKGNLINIHNFKQGKLVDTSTFYRVNGSVKMKKVWIDSVYHKQIRYDKSGLIKAMGNMNDDDLKIDKWSFFKEGKLDFIREYKIIRGKQYLNQSWNIDKEGDTIFKGSKFSNIQIVNDDVIKEEKPFTAVAYLQVQLFKEKPSEILVCIPAEEDENFTRDFSNEREIKLDTFYNLLYDIKNQEQFSNDISKHYTVAFGRRFKKVAGRKALRGFIDEYYIEGDSIISSKIYFDIPIYIKDKEIE